MSRTITALFDTREDAEAGAERLRQAGVQPTHVNIHASDDHDVAGGHTTAGDQGLWAKLKHAFVPHEDRHAYEEGLRRGGVLLTADVDEDRTPDAVAALEDANSIDLDQRTQQWRDDGWAYQPADMVDGADEGILYGAREPGYASQRFRSYSVER